MPLETVYFLSQIIAAIAIIATLVFVGAQVRQNTEQLKRANTANMLTNEAASAALTQNGFLALAADPALGDVVHRGRRNLSELDDSERRRFNNYMMAMLHPTQVGYLNYRRGTSPDAYWQAHAGGLVPLLRSPGARDWWRHARMNFLPEARAFFDGLSGDGPLQPPGLYGDHPALANAQPGYTPAVSEKG